MLGLKCNAITIGRHAVACRVPPFRCPDADAGICFWLGVGFRGHQPLLAMSHGRPIHQICCSCVKLRSCFLCPSGCRKAVIGHATTVAPGWYHSLHPAFVGLDGMDWMDWSPGQSIASRPFPSPKPSLTASTCYAAGLMVIQLIRYCRWEGDFVVKCGCALKVCFPESFASWWWSAFEISWNFRSCCDRHKPQN